MITSKTYPMDFKQKLLTWTIGLFGGMLKFIDLQLLDISFWTALGRASFTSVVLGIATTFGVRIYTKIIEPWATNRIKYIKAKRKK